jgi:hypothetical protein
MALSDFCLSVNYGNLTQYSGNYQVDGSYNGKNYYTGSGATTAYIYFNTGNTSWCLSETLGGDCILFGKSNCTNNDPDLCDTLFSYGFCLTPTPTPTINCDSFTFEAVFQCDIPTSPTPTPTPTTTTTPTVTPTPTNVCSTSLNNFTFTFTQVTPSPTPTPTVTPSFGPIARDCSFSGSATFNTINDTIICPQTKQFRDCETGQMYYTNDSLGSDYTIIIDRIYNATVNGSERCVSYVGSSLNSGIDSVSINNGPYGVYSENGCSQGCSGSPVTPSPTPTPTITPTNTPTPTITPTIPVSSTPTPTTTPTTTPTPTPISPMCFVTEIFYLVPGNPANPKFSCTTQHSGYFNGKPYFNYNSPSDCTTPLPLVVYWNSSLNRWEQSTNDIPNPTYVLSYNNNSGSYPSGSWVRITVPGINYGIVQSSIGSC